MQITSRQLLIGTTISLSVIASFFTVQTAFAADTKESCEAAGGTWSVVNSGPGGQNQVGTCTPKPSFTQAIAMSPDDQLRSYAYYTALSQCSRGSGFNLTISEANANNPSKWGSGDGVSVGYLVDSQDGLLSCSEIMPKALALWGYTSDNYSSALKSFGYSEIITETCVGAAYMGNGACSGGTIKKTLSWVKGSDALSDFQRTIKSRIYVTSDPSLDGNPGLLYYRGQAHLEMSSACGATPYKKVSELSAAEKEKYEDNNPGTTTTTGSGSFATTTGSFQKDYLIVKLVDGTTWKAENWVYKITTSNWNKQIKLGEKPSGGSVDTTCVAISIDMAGYADRIATDAANIIAAGGNPADKYGAIIKTPGSAGVDNSGTGGNTDTESSCGIEGIGWIVCPMMTFLSSVADSAFNLVSDWFLKIDPSYVDNGGGTYIAWSIVRNIANVLFLVVFLVIIYSQMTGAGISNYGVKKMLPRIVIGAILVNVSFLLCQLAVDITNILGYEITKMFRSIATQILASGGQAGLKIESFNFAGLIGGLLIAGGVAYALLSLTSAVVIGAVLAILLLVLLLVVRKVLIILLIVLAPIAFVAFLLPNTDQYFKLWRQAFVRLLMVFPIIALCFGAGMLARAVIQTSTSNPDATQLEVKQ